MSVFNYNFEKLIAQKVIRILYLIDVVLLSLFAAFCLVVNFSENRYNELLDGGRQALGVLIVGAAYSILLIFSRVAYESIMIRFQMAEDMRVIRKALVADSNK